MRERSLPTSGAALEERLHPVCLEFRNPIGQRKHVTDEIGVGGTRLALVRIRPLDAFDDGHFDRASGRLKLQPELLLQGSEQVRCVRQY